MSVRSTALRGVRGIRRYAVSQGLGEGNREGVPNWAFLSGKILIVSGSLSLTFLVGLYSRPRKRKRINRESPCKNRENLKKIKKKIKKRTTQDGGDRIGKPHVFETAPSTSLWRRGSTAASHDIGPLCNIYIYRTSVIRWCQDSRRQKHLAGPQVPCQVDRGGHITDFIRARHAGRALRPAPEEIRKKACAVLLSSRQTLPNQFKKLIPGNPG